MGTATQDRINALVEWATCHGATLNQSVEVYDSPETGLSFRVSPSAAASLQPWESIVSIPTSLTLSYVDALRSSFLPTEVLSSLKPHVVGRLFLIKQFLLGEASFWHPYIAALPQPLDKDAWALPPFWDDDDAELLEGTNVEVGVEKIRADVKSEYEGAAALLRAHHAANEDVSHLLGKLSARLYQWAYCIFSSRSFKPSLVLSPQDLPAGASMDDFSVLLPLFDVGNHDMTAPVRWDLCPDDDSDGNGNGNGNEKAEKARRHRCHLRVGRPHAPGDQVFNNYSLKTNAELLLGYGFVLPFTEELHNDYTHVRKRTADPDPGAPAEEYYISRMPAAHPSSLLVQSRQPPLLDSPGVLPAFSHVPQAMVWDIFCTLTPSPSQRALLFPRKEEEGKEEGEEQRERRQQNAFLRGDVGDGEARMYLEQTVAIIQHKVLQELERLEETEVEVGEGDEAGLTPRQRLALEYRARCRAVLENTLEAMGCLEEEEEEGEENQGQR